MKEKIIFLILLILIITGVYGFFTFYEYYEEEVNIGWGVEAIKKPYLAAELFLAENDIDTNAGITTKNIGDVPQDTTLFIENADKLLLTTQRIDSVLTWAQRGGNLILSVSGDEEFSSGELFERLNIQVNYIHDEALAFEQKKLSEQLEELSANAVPSADNEETPEVYIPIIFDDGEILHTGLSEHKSFELNAEASLDVLAISENESGIYFLQVAYGRGAISLLPDNNLWDSTEIGFLDNAYFLLKLIDGDLLSIIYTGQSLSLWQLLMLYAYEFLLIVALSIFIWVWSSLVRRGRVILPTPIARRALSDYVFAMSEFFMANHHHKPLLKAVKQDVFDSLLKRDRSFLNYDVQTQAVMIVEYCQTGHYQVADNDTLLTIDHVQQWLENFEKEVIDDIVFVEQVMLCHKIKKRL